MACVRLCGQSINATVEILPTVKCQVDLGRVLGINSFNLQKVLDMDPSFLQASRKTYHLQMTHKMAVHAVSCMRRRASYMP